MSTHAYTYPSLGRCARTAAGAAGATEPRAPHGAARLDAEVTGATDLGAARARATEVRRVDAAATTAARGHCEQK